MRSSIAWAGKSLSTPTVEMLVYLPECIAMPLFMYLSSLVSVADQQSMLTIYAWVPETLRIRFLEKNRVSKLGVP